MGFYQQTKQMKAAVIGSIIPWSGPLSEIPDGWIICDGGQPNAEDYPLLVQAIGDTYNEGTSNLGGAFPAYTGQFKLPDLLGGRMLMDIEGSYFTDPSSGIDTNAARSIIEPYIGENTDNGVQTVFNDVKTDVEFNLNDRSGYTGNISGNTIIPGQGEKVVYVGGRKLGHQHVRSHGHSGVYDTIRSVSSGQPGLGVVPYDNIEVQFNYASYDRRNYALGITGGDFQVDVVRFGLKSYYQDGQALNTASELLAINTSGFGGGSPGRSVGKIKSEIPPYNLKPLALTESPLATWGEWRPLPSTPSDGRPRLAGGDIIPFALFGGNLELPTGVRNWYLDVDAAGNYQTFTSNNASAWSDATFQAHAHDPFVVEYDQNSLKPQTRLDSTANIPLTTVLDNASNAGALQINMNTSQPSVTCVYIIRAY